MLTVTLDRKGNTPVELTPIQNSMVWTTAAVGGFGSCTFKLAGDQRQQLGHLGILRVLDGQNILWEGQLEDQRLSQDDNEVSTSVKAFGLRRLLDEVTVQRVWSKRDLSWDYYERESPSKWAVVAGQLDPADLTKTGVAMVGTGVATAAGQDRSAIAVLPGGVTLVRLMGTYAEEGATGSFAGQIASRAGSTVTIHTSALAAGSFDQALAANATAIILGVYPTGAFTTASTDQGQFHNLRALGTTLTEDAAGGFYGGTLLRDLIALVPGLTAGLIETGSDFTIQSIERAVRDRAASIVAEITGYYTREWAVWEDGRLDWITRNLDEPQWTVGVEDLAELDLEGSVDGIARTVYVLYTDAASGLTAEASAASTVQCNPYVKQSRTKDQLVQPGFPMTSASAQQLATKLAADIGGWVPVSGHITLPAALTVQNAVGAARRAYNIRAGENILIHNLPKTDVFQNGRDGETLFHIVSTNTDLERGTVTLELEGQARRADVLLARLAAATRVVTG